ncbi:MAG: alpha/beta hydrolase [Acidobacteriia bacterium]|nr:alpha/beta hydrolase [Terriglobia bacterium]
MVDSARRRVIVTRPKAAGRYPAVLIMGGLGCYSLDGEIARPAGYGPILAALAKGNFVTMRLEKTGEGDSQGPPCTDPKATAQLEARGYVAGLRALKAYDFVDSAKVFVFAHSLGPLIGSLVVPQEPVRGFIAAETVGRSWFEYILDNARRQRPLMGVPLDVVDAQVRAEEKCAHRFFVEHQPAEEIVKLGPECEAMIRSYAGVPGAYMQQIGDLSLAKQWKQADIPVLVIYGTSDPATSAAEGRYLTEIINSFHPGRATYAEIREMGHDFTHFASQRDYLNRRNDPSPHPFETALLEVLFNWLERQLAG